MNSCIDKAIYLLDQHRLGAEAEPGNPIWSLALMEQAGFPCGDGVEEEEEEEEKGAGSVCHPV